MTSRTERMYCRECFIGWQDDAVECWQCGCPFAITRAEGRAVLDVLARHEGTHHERTPECDERCTRRPL